MQNLIIIRPNDMNLHKSHGDELKDVNTYKTPQKGRALIMPNLVKRVANIESKIK